jgi:hypothetical protein
MIAIFEDLKIRGFEDYSFCTSTPLSARLLRSVPAFYIVHCSLFSVLLPPVLSSPAFRYNFSAPRSPSAVLSLSKYVFPEAALQFAIYLSIFAASGKMYRGAGAKKSLNDRVGCSITNHI